MNFLLLRSHQSSLHENQLIIFNEKAEADIVEAFFGAMAIEFGIERVIYEFGRIVSVLENSLFPLNEPSLWDIAWKKRYFDETIGTYFPFDYISDHLLKSLSTVESKIKYTFKNKALLTTSLTHGSAFLHSPTLCANERYEYLGDAVLQYIISKTLFETNPLIDEGQMTHARVEVVKNVALSAVVHRLHLEQHLLYARDQVRNGLKNVEFCLLIQTKRFLLLLLL